MKYGSVRARSFKFLIMGFTGVGKSHVLAMIVGERPPGIHCSTPCLTRPVRLMRIGRMGKQWGRVGEREMMALVARAAKARSLATTVRSGATPMQPAEETSQHIEPKSQVEGNAGAPSVTPRQGPVHSKQLPSIRDMDAASPRDSISSSTVKIEDCLLEMIDEATGLTHINLDLVSAVNTGGQPNFLEVIANYLDKNTTIVIVLKLSKELSAYPIVEYYNKKGECIGVPYHSAFTNGQIVRGCMRAAQPQAMKSSDGKCPKVVIIGTHKDLEDTCSETRAQKNEKLQGMIASNVKDEIIYYGEEMKEIIFPVNAKVPGLEEEKIAEKLREIIVEKSLVEPTNIPLHWYGLDVAIHKLMKDLKRGVLSKAECQDVSERFQFNEKSLEEALKYLTSLNILHYYDTVLPEVVFADPQVPLDKHTELVEYNYTNYEKIQPLVQLSKVFTDNFENKE